MSTGVLIDESPGALRETVLRLYSSTFADPLMQRWFDHSGFANFGFWQDETVSAVDASRSLVARLIGMVPRARPLGAMLDVACGAGGTTSELWRHCRPAHVTAVDIAPDQLARAARLVPDASFRVMDATELAFEEATFDVVLCVEAAHHFHTRARFLAAAYRVLKPGGFLVLSDVLFQTPVSLLSHIRYEALTRLSRESPPDYARANVVANLDAYAELFRLIGFDDVVVRDEIDRTWRAFHRRHRAYLLRAAMAQPMLLRTVVSRLRTFAIWNTVIYAYPLVAARKPLAVISR